MKNTFQLLFEFPLLFEVPLGIYILALLFIFSSIWIFRKILCGTGNNVIYAFIFYSSFIWLPLIGFVLAGGLQGYKLGNKEIYNWIFMISIVFPAIATLTALKIKNLDDSIGCFNILYVIISFIVLVLMYFVVLFL